MRCALVSYWRDISQLLPELKNYDKIFACELAAYHLLQQGIELERIISDFDSVPLAKFSEFAVQTEQLPAEKNETDTHVLLQYIVDTFPLAEVTLYNDFGNRLDHALALLSLFAVKEDLLIKTPGTLMYQVQSGTYELSPKPAYQYISFLGLTEVKGLTISGLKYTLRATDIDPFLDLTISNEFRRNEPATVALTTGRLLIMYTRDGSG